MTVASHADEYHILIRDARCVVGGWYALEPDEAELVLYGFESFEGDDE